MFGKRIFGLYILGKRAFDKYVAPSIFKKQLQAALRCVADIHFLGIFWFKDSSIIVDLQRSMTDRLIDEML